MAYRASQGAIRRPGSQALFPVLEKVFERYGRVTALDPFNITADALRFAGES